MVFLFGAVEIVSSADKANIAIYALTRRADIDIRNQGMSYVIF